MWYATGKIVLKHTMNWVTFLNFTQLVNTVVLDFFFIKNQVMLCCVAGSIVPDVLKHCSALVLWNVRQALSTQWHGTTSQGSQHFSNCTVRKSNPITNVISIIITFLSLINNMKIQCNSTSRFTYRFSQWVWLHNIKYSRLQHEKKMWISCSDLQYITF